MIAETVSLGAAYMAGLAADYWSDLEVLRGNWHRAARWMPAMQSSRRAFEHGEWTRAVERTFDWARR